MAMANQISSRHKVDKAIPLKQGLKHANLLFLVYVPIVDKAIPLKQGLKHREGTDMDKEKIVDKAIPLKQGLKPNEEYMAILDRHVLIRRFH